MHQIARVCMVTIGRLILELVNDLEIKMSYNNIYLTLYIEKLCRGGRGFRNADGC